MDHNDDNPKIIVYGNYINSQHIDVQNNYFGEEKKRQPQPKETHLSAVALKPYVDAKMLTPDLMPAEGLSRGEKAVLAHDIAERLKMKNFWAFFEKKWGLTYLSSAYGHFTNTKKFAVFQNKLYKIE